MFSRKNISNVDEPINNQNKNVKLLGDPNWV